MKINKLLTIIVVTVLSALSAGAQDYVDSLIYRPSAALDSTLYGKSIFNLMPSRQNGDEGEVKIHQSSAIAQAISDYIKAGESRAIQGFRVRIFFDNSQNARGESEATLERFSEANHGIPAYRSYQNPFFKVTVGDFRTRSEAMELLERIRAEYPAAFVVKENINYP